MCIITTTMTSTLLGSLGVILATKTAAMAATALAVGANAALGAGAIAGVASGGISALNQAKQQQAMYNYQAKVQEENAKIAQNNADSQRQQGIEEARLQRIKTAQAIGSQKTAIAANGVDITSSTALDTIEDTAAMGELDALQTRANYERQAQAYEAQAKNFKNQGRLDIIAGKNAYSAGKINALASGVEGITKAGTVAAKWFL